MLGGLATPQTLLLSWRASPRRRPARNFVEHEADRAGGDSWDPLNDGTSISAAIDDDDDNDITESSQASASSGSASPSIFSSVFDVAREAVSILNGPSSHYYYQNDQNSSDTSAAGTASSLESSSSRGVRKQQFNNTSSNYMDTLLVDTLYLF